MKEIELTQNKVAYVDDEDYERLNKFNWYAGKRGRTFYAIRSVTISPKVYKKIYMHHDVLNCISSNLIDHKNHNGLDNRKDNIRFATKANNSMNGPSEYNSTSKYRGVCVSRSRWSAQIHVNGKKKHLGVFNIEEDAARAYDKAAKEFFGEFANPNFK